MQTREKTLYVDAGTFASALRAVVESGVHEGAERVTLERRPGDVQRFRMTIVEPEPEVAHNVARRLSRHEVLLIEFDRTSAALKDAEKKVETLRDKLLDIDAEICGRKTS